MLVAERMGYDLVDPRGERALAVVETMNKGHAAEDRVVEKMAEEGVVIEDRDGTVNLIVTNKIEVVGHYDGWAQSPHGGAAPGDRYFVEIKSLSDEEWGKFWRVDGGDFSHGRWPINLWQMSCYAAATELDCWLVVYNRDSDEMRYLFPTLPYGLAEIRRRVLDVERQARLYDLPPTCDTPLFPCPVFYMHESDRLEFEEEDDSIVQGLAEVFDEKRKARDDAEKQYKAAQKALLKAVGRTGKFETLQGWKVTSYDPGKGALDVEKVKAFIKEHGGDVEEFKAMALRVTPSKREENGE